MILSDLRSYLKQQHRVSLADLVTHFGIDADALRGMLSKWINKGNVRLVSLQSSCSTSCCKCDPTLTELYEWINK
jgi:hypothetical protein